MTVTAQSIIDGAAKKLGIMRKSEALSGDESTDGLTLLNDLIASWSNDGLVCTSRSLESFSTVGGTASYTMGTGGTFSTTRPQKFVSAYINLNTIDYELNIITDQEYAETVPYKTVQSSIPNYLSYDNGYPLQTLKLFPVPAASGTIKILSEKALTEFAALSTTFDMSPGWRLALKYNLAFAWAPEFGVPCPAEVVETARKSLGALRGEIIRNRPIVMHTTPSKKINILADGL